jgi:hypothetical protein
MKPQSNAYFFCEASKVLGQAEFMPGIKQTYRRPLLAPVKDCSCCSDEVGSWLADGAFWACRTASQPHYLK